MKKVLKLLAKIPQRHYFPIFVILSLYFVVPYSEFVVTLTAPLYFIFEVPIRSAIGKLALPPWLGWGGSVIFFLVMIDDYLFYFALIALALWCSRNLPKDRDHATIDESTTDHETTSHP